MLEVTVLASGSAGNALLVRGDGTAVLVDAGLSAKRLLERLAECEQSVEELTGILLTHEHSDHTSALQTLSKRCVLPLYSNSFTAEAVQQGGRKVGDHSNWKRFTTGSRFRIGQFEVETFGVPHDAVDPVGFVIRGSGSSFGVLTDLGHATAAHEERLAEVDGLLVEANYDEELLRNDRKRPWTVKQRIASKHGHLSNVATAKVVRSLAQRTGRLKRVVLGHLSTDCNTPALAAQAVEDALEGADVEVFCAEQHAVSPRFQV